MMKRLVCAKCKTAWFSSITGWLCGKCGGELKEEPLIGEIYCPRCKSRLISPKQTCCHECGELLEVD